jgi:hypothetical protein
MGFMLLACIAPLVKKQKVAKIEVAKNGSCAEPLGGAPAYVAG